MKIERVRTRIVTKRSARPERNPLMAWKEKNVLLVAIETDAGLAGIGEAWCDGGSPGLTAALIATDLAPLLVGQDARQVARHWQRIMDTTTYSLRDGMVFSALSGIDIALWDLLGKHCGVPVSTLLGGYADRIFAYASGGLYADGKTARELADEMLGYVKRGFRGVKIKAGGAPFCADVERVAAVREAIGADIRLMVDAVYALTVPEAKRLARALERYDVHFLEAPVHPADVAGLAEVARTSPVPLAGNEFAYGRGQFKRLLDAKAVEYVHLDAIVCGGITEAARIAALAGAYHRPCSFHAASSAVCFAANLHVAAATPRCDSIEYHMIHQMLWDQLPAASREPDASGCIAVPQGPGLGLAPGILEDLPGEEKRRD